MRIMLLTHSKSTPSCRTLLGCGIFICILSALSGCGSFSSKPNTSKVSQFKQDTSVGTEDISIAAVGLVDIPYRYGVNTPRGCFDCSGLIGFVYRSQAGLRAPRTVLELQGWGQPVVREQVRTGDLVLFSSGGSASHAGVYVGAGRFVHAPSTGGSVRLDRLDGPYWSRQIVAFRRP